MITTKFCFCFCFPKIKLIPRAFFFSVFVLELVLASGREQLVPKILTNPTRNKPPYPGLS